MYVYVRIRLQTGPLFLQNILEICFGCTTKFADASIQFILQQFSAVNVWALGRPYY